MRSPEFSIIVPVYNTEKYLPECLDSLLAQTFEDFELLLINDGSTDNSRIICDEYAQKDSRIRVFHKKNGGVSSARNIGIKEAKGEWVSFVDSDDRLADNFLERMRNNALELNVDAVFCNCFYLYDNQCVPNLLYAENTIADNIEILKKFLIVFGIRSELWGKIIKRKFLGTQKLKEDVKIGEDLLYLMELYYSNHCKTAFLTEPLYYYRQLNTSVMNKSDPVYHGKKLLMEFLQFLESHSDIKDKYALEKATFIVRTIISFAKKDAVNATDPVIMNLLKENYKMAEINLQKNEKRFARLLYFHPVAAKMEQSLINLFFERTTFNK